MKSAPTIKPLIWVGGSKKGLLEMPEEVQDVFGFALHEAQIGKKHDQAKPMKGFGRQASWRSWRIGAATPTAPSTP